jgi:DNA-binding ferritin-like protein
MTDVRTMQEGVMESMGAPRDCADAVALLVACAAWVKELETQAHLVHFNYTGSNFLSVHGFLKGQYELHLEQFDVLGEHVRALNYLMPLCGCDLKKAAEGFTAVDGSNGIEMLAIYYGNLEKLACMATELESVAGECCAVDVQDTAAEVVGATRKAAWFIKATLGGC